MDCEDPEAGAQGVRGVLGVDMYRPLHFGQRTESSVEDDKTERTGPALPFLLGWYR